MFYSFIALSTLLLSIEVSSSNSNTNSCFLFDNKITEPFSSSEVKTMRTFFLNNINIDSKGGVAAAPKETMSPAGSYYYHWMRDAGLTIRRLILFFIFFNYFVNNNYYY